ncbi:MAG: Sbal_3080 family lipoprotein [Massilia sp.]
MKTRLVFAALALAVLGGCAIHQTVQPVASFGGKEVCIVKNPSVRDGFLNSFTHSLTERGYTVRQLDAGSSLVACPVTAIYAANWRWDLSMYMAYADISVYNNAKPAGKATYDATRGGGNMSKFIDADKKIKELVAQLFPPAS